MPGRERRCQLYREAASGVAKVVSTASASISAVMAESVQPRWPWPVCRFGLLLATLVSFFFTPALYRLWVARAA